MREAALEHTLHNFGASARGGRQRERDRRREDRSLHKDFELEALKGKNGSKMAIWDAFGALTGS
jgi:hypothetical protein